MQGIVLSHGDIVLTHGDIYLHGNSKKKLEMVLNLLMIQSEE
jgi:hypothetical protein